MRTRSWLNGKSLMAVVTCLIVTFGDQTAEAADTAAEYYKVKPIFNPYPGGGRGYRDWNVKNFGPVGIGIDLKKPLFTMVIKNVEKGSPAEKTGKLKKGQIIESINGTILEDRDPREILGDIITKAEATDGKIKLKIKGEGEVVVEIPVMGSYGPNWPLDCEKSDKIVRNLADLLAAQETPKWGSVLFLLSTGEEKDLEVVRNWMAKTEDLHTYPWYNGYRGIGVCEYYLRTGDKAVLPIIKKACDNLLSLEYEGGWSGRGHASFTYMGGGQLHAAGVHCLTFLLMARRCGVEVDNGMLQRSLKAFYRFAGRGNVAYGDQLPEGGYRDNGKTGALAVAMAAASLLTPDGETSVYAKARDNSAMKSFYATSWFHAAHTGGGIGEIWHNASMSMMSERRPVQYRSFLDTRRWVMELSRRHTGAIGIAGMTDGYDASATDGKMSWGTFFALTYTIPRKKLQLFGAAPTKWCKSFQLPARPWGTAADDTFQLMTPVPEEGGITMKEVLSEFVERDAVVPVVERLNAEAPKGDAILLKYLAHPEFGLRSNAMRTAVANGRANLVVPLLKSKDPRSRHNGILAITGMFKGSALSADQLTPEMFALVGKIIEDKDESWWVTQDAIHALGRADVETIARHRDRLIELLALDAWWVQMAAVKTLSKIAFKDEYYEKVLPPLLKAYVSFRSDMAQSMPMKDIMAGVKSAKPNVQKVAFKLFADSYNSIPREIIAVGGHRIPSAGKVFRSRMSQMLSPMPGGTELVRSIPKITTAYAASGDDADLYRYSGTFEPNEKVVGTWHKAIYPRPKTEGQLQKAAETWINSEKRKKSPNQALQILPKGKVKSNIKAFRNYFWSGDMLVGISDGIARKMEIRKFGGQDFMILEVGGFEEGKPVEWDKKYTFFMKAK